jgi:methylmalonyl-CoA mutase
MTWRQGQGDGPQVFVAAVGTLAELAARIDFSRGFFEVGGFTVTSDQTFTGAAEACEAAVASGAPIVVVLSTDDRYPEIVPAMALALKAAQPGVVLVVAGFPKDHIEPFKQAGIDEFIHVRSDVHATLAALAQKVGVKA